MKTLKLEQDVGALIPQIIGDTSQELSEDAVIQQMQEAEVILRTSLINLRTFFAFGKTNNICNA